jgi:endoglucanase
MDGPECYLDNMSVCRHQFLLITLILVVSCQAVFAMEAGKSKTVDIYAANSYLSKTINIAFTFDAPKEGDWGHTLQASDFKLIKDAGFTAIRLPIQWVTRMNPEAPFTIDQQFLARIDWAIREALKNHLAIILDNHLDYQLMKEPSVYRERFLGLWKQLSAHYRHKSQQVMFEVMAEPNGQLDAVWNDYFKEALAIIRGSNPTRPVIVGPSSYNMAYKLNDLQLPHDDYLIVTCHYYNPIHFTMQGEDWFPMGKPREWIGTTWIGSEQEKNDVIHTMDMISNWAKKNNRPVFLGEFGAGDHADTASKARYFRCIREQAELHGFSWGVFNFAVKFSLYDQAAKAWRQDLLQALIPAVK